MEARPLPRVRLGSSGQIHSGTRAGKERQRKAGEESRLARSASALIGGWGATLGDAELGNLYRETRSRLADARLLSRERELAENQARKAHLCAPAHRNAVRLRAAACVVGWRARRLPTSP